MQPSPKWTLRMEHPSFTRSWMLLGRLALSSLFTNPQSQHGTCPEILSKASSISCSRVRMAGMSQNLGSTNSLSHVIRIKANWSAIRWPLEVSHHKDVLCVACRKPRMRNAFAVVVTLHVTWSRIQTVPQPLMKLNSMSDCNSSQTPRGLRFRV